MRLCVSWSFPLRVSFEKFPQREHDVSADGDTAINCGVLNLLIQVKRDVADHVGFHGCSFQLPPFWAGLVVKRGADRAATAALAVMRPDLTDQARFLFLPVAPDDRRRSGDQLIAARATGSLAAKHWIPPSVACMFCGHFPCSFVIPISSV